MNDQPMVSMHFLTVALRPVVTGGCISAAGPGSNGSAEPCGFDEIWHPMGM